MSYDRPVLPDRRECTDCGRTYDGGPRNLCDCGGPVFAWYDYAEIRKDDLRPRKDLWRYAPSLLPLEEA